MSAIAFDCGGTHIRFSMLKRNGIYHPEIFTVPRTYRDFLDLMKREIRHYFPTTPPTDVVGGIAGVLDKKKIGLTQSTHLPFFVGKNLRRDIFKICTARVFLENDNALVGLGEAHYGAGRGYSIVAYIGIGTGIGGTRIVDGIVDRHAFGFEPGHHYLNISIKRHSHVSPHPGDWESQVSGSAIRTHLNISARQLKKKSEWKRLADLTAYGLINVTVFWSPHVIVLGGSLLKRLPLKEIRSAYKRRMGVFKNTPHILKGTLGDYGCLYGARALLTQRNTSYA